jgi:hypothetical protein
MTLPRAGEPTAAAEVSVGADRWLAFARRGHDYCSQISEVDCLIRLDNFRAAFEGYIGIDYSGAARPTSRRNGLRVYLAERTLSPVEVEPPSSPVSTGPGAASPTKALQTVADSPTRAPPSGDS